MTDREKKLIMERIIKVVGFCFFRLWMYVLWSCNSLGSCFKCLPVWKEVYFHREMSRRFRKRFHHIKRYLCPFFFLLSIIKHFVHVKYLCVPRWSRHFPDILHYFREIFCQLDWNGNKLLGSFAVFKVKNSMWNVAKPVKGPLLMLVLLETTAKSLSKKSGTPDNVSPVAQNLKGWSEVGSFLSSSYLLDHGWLGTKQL